MGLVRKSKKKESSNNQLFLKIYANRAAELIPNNIDESTTDFNSSASATSASKKSVNPVLVASLNNSKSKTNRKLHTTQPTWDSTLVIPLKENDYSQIVTLTIWDKHTRYKNYLGELRLKVSDLFLGKETASKTDLKWYKLYSGKSFQGFVTGSVLLSFELEVKARRRQSGKRKSSKDEDSSAGAPPSNSSNSSLPLPKLVVKPPTLTSNDVFSKLESMKLSEESDELDLVTIDTVDEKEKISLFQNWIDSLLIPTPDTHLYKPDDQGFYTNEVSAAIADASDIESMATMATESTLPPSLQAEPINSLLTSQVLSHSILASDSEFTSMSDASSMSEFSVDDENSNEVPPGTSPTEHDLRSQVLDRQHRTTNKSKESHEGKKKRRFGRRRRSSKHKSKLSSNFELSNRKVLGVLFLEILSCSDLPPMKNITRTSFDMDPFVVVTFGKRTFRTSWKRHTLNPIFNERLAFEILPHEKNYNIKFSILDKDSFSFHDKVANISLMVNELTKISGDSNSQSQPGNKGVSTSNEASFSLNLDSATAERDNVDSGSTASQNIKFSDDPNMVSSIKKKRFSKRKKITVSYADTSKFKTIDLALDLHKEKYVGKYSPVLKIRARFEPYESLRRQFWKVLLERYHIEETTNTYDYIELIAFLDTLGCQDSDDIVNGFFNDYDRSMWGGDTLTIDEISDSLEKHIDSSVGSVKIFEIEKCPICLQKRFANKQDIDIVTHVAICASKDWSIASKLLLFSYDTPEVATRRWFSKALIKISYGKYKLGSNSANILVQDRRTGIIMEEKMGVYVRLGIRLLYKGLDSAKSRRIRQLLKKLSVKQGSKFDNPSSKNDIPSFIKFHRLDLAECLEEDMTKYDTFNEFFYRKLKPDARPNASEDERIVVSPADCRCTVFKNVNDATELWVKGRNFTLAKLFNGNLNDLEDSNLYKANQCSLGIFRLAPQDYHRFHSPVTGKVRQIKQVDGEYYTVNPMAIRSELDVFGENVRTLITIDTEHFGTIVMIAVGAMMVGSIVLTIKEEDEIRRGEEVGYFKFGGSTILLLFQSKYFQFDSDMVDNSLGCIETLIRVGQSVGHHPDVEECSIGHIDFNKQSKDFKLNLIRVLTGGDLSNAKDLSNWEASKLEIEDDDEIVLSEGEGLGKYEPFDEEEEEDEVGSLDSE
ncbi:phosphatidylserine decarboxylase proenzyme 2 [[Candida] railenensis]|uniref:Phosphatidylserine decarboxylase proenzyme 2 n=1 Tax=[Candida] railenensis TaxID=45579 RepID=A0A9P0QT64_9ASCO|nr:phosphatidylserine decarboxylase proenzyme 2 [[Candida] railenensis]